MPPRRRDQSRHQPKAHLVSPRVESLEDRRLLSLTAADPLGSWASVAGLGPDAGPRPDPAAPAERGAVDGATKALVPREVDPGGTPRAPDSVEHVVPITWHGTPTWQEQGGWIARFDTGASLRDQQVELIGQSLNGLAARVSRQLGVDGMVHLRTPGDVSFDFLNATLSSVPGFRYIVPNFVDRHLAAAPDDPLYPDQYHHDNTGQTGGTVDADVDTTEAWDITTGNSSVVVGIIDSGIDVDHPDLIPNLWTNPGETPGDGLDNDGNGYVDDVHGYDFIQGDGNPDDAHGHGTHVSGIAGAQGDNGIGVSGVAWDVQLMGVRIFDDFGSTTDAAILEAVAYTVMMKRDFGVNMPLTNNSWGGGPFSQALLDVINEAEANDQLFIAAAGNGFGTDNDVFPFYPASYDAPNIISVASTDHNDQLSVFSNLGVTTVDVAAPGSAILSTMDPNGVIIGNPSGYGAIDGTSMATPVVSGIAALGYSLLPSADYATIRDAILAGVEPLASLDGLVATGGRVNARNTLIELDAMAVVGSVPADGETVTTPPTEFVIDFSFPYDPATVDAADLTVNGIPADSVAQTDERTLTFSYATSPVTAEGVQAMAMAEGAVLQLADGDPLLPFAATFRYDAIPLAVVATTPPAGSSVELPLTRILLDFNEEVDPASVDPSDLLTSIGIVTALTPVDDDTLEATIDGLDVEGTLTLTLPPGRLTDDAGNPNVLFTGSYELDFGVVPFPADLSPSLPLGSLAHDATVSGLLGTAGDADTFTLSLDPGQTIAVVADPDGPVRLEIALLDGSGNPIASATTAAPGETAVIGATPLPGVITGDGAPQDYSIVVSQVGGTTGGYDLRVVLNAALEPERFGGPGNGSTGSAQAIEGAFIPLDAVAGPPSVARPERAAVGGRVNLEGYQASVESFEFQDISDTGTRTLSGTDDVAVNLAESDLDGFAFDFFGSTHTSLFYSDNGLITFGSPNTDFNFSGSDLTFSPDQAAIAPYWSDLVVPASAGVYWEVLGSGDDQRLVIQWDDVEYYPGGFFPPLTFQAVLHEADGSIEFNYLQDSFEFAFGTAGVKAAGFQGPDRVLLSNFDGPNAFIGEGRSALVRPSEADVDVFAIELAAYETLSLSTTVSGVGDVELTLLDPAGNPIAAGHDLAGNLDDAITEYLATAPGTYYARVRGSGEYTLVATRNATFEGEGDQGLDDAHPLHGRVVGGRRYALGETGGAVASTVITMDEVGFVPADGQTVEGVTFDFKLFGEDSSDAFLGAFGPGQTRYVSDPSLEGNAAGILTMDFEEPSSFLSFGLVLSTTIPVDPGVIVELYDPDDNLIGTFDLALQPEGFVFTEGLFEYEGSPVARAVLDFNELAAGRFVLDNVTLGGADSDFYEITVPGNRNLELETLLPAAGEGAFDNGLDPMIRLYDASGTLLASDDDGAADGRNARLVYRTPRSDTRTYYVEVLGAGATRGEYVLAVRNANGVLPPFEALAIDPEPGALRKDADSFTIDFNDNVLLSSVSPADLLVNGVAAVGVEVVDGNTLVFTSDVEFQDGEVTLSIPAGAITDTQGSPLSAFSSTFTIDRTPPRILSSSLAQGQILEPGDLTVTVTFDEPMNTAGIDASDTALFGLYRGNSFLPALSFDPTGTILTLEYSGLPDDAYTLQLLSGDFAFEDLVGNDLDGEPIGFPTGDGVEGGNFFVDFAVDPVAALPVGPFQAILPLGSLIHEASGGDGTIAYDGDADDYVVDVDPGQTITVLVVPSPFGGAVQPRVELLDPSSNVVATAVAAAPGELVLLQTAPITVGGVYTLRISGDSGSQGLYSIPRVILNAAVEEETYSGAPNDDLGTAQDIDPAFVDLDGNASRAGVLGVGDGFGGSSYDAAAVGFEFEDISGTGTPTLIGVDDAAVTLTPADLDGFEFDFFGQAYSALSFSSNGLITFDGPNSSFSNTDLTDSPTQAAIAPLWVDLYNVDTGTVYWDVLGSGDDQRLVIQWHQVEYIFDSGAITFQAVLDEADGSMQFNYLDLDSDFVPGGAVGTVGVKGPGAQGPDRLLLAFDDGPNEYVGTGQSTRITPAEAEIPSDHYSFTVEAGQTITSAATHLPRSGGDLPQIELYDPDGNLVAFDRPSDGNLLTNGSFEAGSFSGWTAIETAGPFVPWQVSGAGAGSGFFPPTSPQDGEFVAWNGFDGAGPMEYLLYQDVSIPAEATTATLEWQDRVQWDFTLEGSSALARDYEVTVLDPADDSVLATLYSFTTGPESSDPFGDTGWLSHSVDVSAFIGQDIRLQFRQVIPEPFFGPGQYELDGVSLTTDLASGPLADNVDAIIGDFVAPTSGTYTVRVIAEGDYSLVVNRDAAFDSEQNDGFDSAQDLGASPAVVGAIEPPPPSGTVVPGGLADVPGNDGNAWPYHIGAFGLEQMRYQQIYSASEFESGGIIEAIRFRLDEFGAPFAATGIDTEIRLSYAATTVGTVSDTFANNIGAGQLTVYDGPLDLSGSGAGFDIVIDVDDLFDYDPSQGDLLVEIFTTGSPITSFFDTSGFGQQDVTTRVYAFETSATTGFVNFDGPGSGAYGLVTAFDIQAETVGEEDWYAIDLDAGQALTLTTLTPADGPGASDNTLDPGIELYDPSGALVATSTVLDDGRNEQIAFTAESAGFYRIRVVGEAGTFGSYVLSTGAGATGGLASIGAPAAPGQPPSSPSGKDPSGRAGDPSSPKTRQDAPAPAPVVAVASPGIDPADPGRPTPPHRIDLPGASAAYAALVDVLLADPEALLPGKPGGRAPDVDGGPDRAKARTPGRSIPVDRDGSPPAPSTGRAPTSSAWARSLRNRDLLAKAGPIFGHADSPTRPDSARGRKSGPGAED
ncbi:S8 family serine peptidase [Tautonia plasticadhaerens]|nr:S8 family serine peptidase [Tautonia plasticadhaerens]